MADVRLYISVGHHLINGVPLITKQITKPQHVSPDIIIDIQAKRTTINLEAPEIQSLMKSEKY
ncbi:hypothetical protein TUM4630_14610 [Shewanella algidipiscicola]|uniref:Uncharacterized protein n=1 Tax=Shewanella algidipiscicola TaxID=614070 RepID=A0ABQ4PE26_9GAMM|nr:hypothetical protein TUM4630_14610 [Shewanella algidipiscicola]